MAYSRGVYIDYYNTDGTIRLQNIGPIWSGGTTKTPQSAKTDNVNNHYCLWKDASNLYLEMARPSGLISTNPSFIKTTSSAQALFTLRGMAKDNNNDFIFIDSSDDVYMLTHDLETVHAITNVGSMDGAATPYRGLCFANKGYVVCGAVGSNYRLAHVVAIDGGTWTESFAIFAKQALPTLAVAWNERDYLVLTPSSTASPSTGYHVYIYRYGPPSSGGLGYQFATRTSFTGYNDEVTYGILPIDVDWDGRNWLVYWSGSVDLGA